MQFLATVVLALTLTTSASSGAPKACALLTNAQAAHLIGGKIETRTPGGSGQVNSCTWAGPPLGTFTSVHAQLFVQARRMEKAQFTKNANAMQGVVRVHGVGDVAFVDTGPGKVLQAWQKGYSLLIQASRTADDMQTEKAAATAVFARL
jgi:hypothetical protein